MTHAVLSPEEAIYYFQQEHVEGPGLAEALARYPYWQVAVQEPDTFYQPLVHMDAKGRLFLNIFSKTEYIQVFLEKWGMAYKAKYLAESVGYFIFKHLPQKLSYINIDPETKHGIHYRKGQLKLLQTMGEMVEIDESLSKLSQITKENQEAYADVFQYLKGYRFHVVMFPNFHIASAPEAYGDKLITAFTSEHAALEFIGWLKFNYPKRNLPVVDEVMGEILFNKVTKTSLHGVVVNCQGPIRPMTISRKLCEWMIK
ncbi:MAG: hypothetical protein ACPGJS_02430 [Flammeovirgaceae bacterium]